MLIAQVKTTQGSVVVQQIEPIITAMRHAADLCQRVQAGASAHHKHNGPVTIADYGAQAIIARAIHHVFPDDAIVAEENASDFKRLLRPEEQADIAAWVAAVLGEPVTVQDLITWLDYGQDVASTSKWIIDPIDGTRGFIERQAYIIGVGLVEEGRAMGALMGCPTYGDGELLVGWDGVAYRMPLYAEGPIKPLCVSARGLGEPIYPVDAITAGRAGADVEKRVKATFALQEPLLPKVYAQLEIYAAIARGESDIFLCKPMTRCSRKVWDHAAGVALVEAAGGIVTDFEGASLDFSQGDTIPNQSLIISNGRIHPYLLDTVKLHPKFI